MAFSRKPRKEMDVQRREHQVECLKLRKRGHSYQEISDILGLGSKAYAHKYVREALEEMVKEPAQDVLALELERLDMATEKCLDILQNGTPSLRMTAMDRLVKLMDRRAKYLGLDTPIKVELEQAQNPVQNLLQDEAGALLVAQAEAYVAGHQVKGE